MDKNSSAHFNGTVDDVRLYSHALSASEILTLYYSGAMPGTQVTARSDTLSNSLPSATSNHTIAFTINNSLDTVGWGQGSGGDATDTLSITLDATFNLNNIFCKDVDISFAGTATSIAGYNTNRSTQQDCPGSATSWGFSSARPRTSSSSTPRRPSPPMSPPARR